MPSVRSINHDPPLKLRLIFLNLLLGDGETLVVISVLLGDGKRSLKTRSPDSLERLLVVESEEVRPRSACARVLAVLVLRAESGEVGASKTSTNLEDVIVEWE